VALAAIALVAVTSAGCSVTNPQTTAQYYMAGDAVEAVLENDVVVTSLLVVAEDAESAGNVIARVVNGGTEARQVQISSADGAVDLSVTVEPGQTVAVGPDGDEEAVLDPVGTVPGGRVPMTVSLDGGQPQELTVPVLDATLPEYADLVPTTSPTG
jgi:hypothetical protein